MIYFGVTESYLKTETHITQNVDAADLSPYIKISSQTYLVPLLGYNFYTYLLAKSDAGTLTPDETILVEFIKPVVAFYAAYEAVPNITYRISNKGIQSQFGEFSASEGIQVLDYIRRNILKYAQAQEIILEAYLDENKDLYPKYETDNDDIKKADNSTNISGISGI